MNVRTTDLAQLARPDRVGRILAGLLADPRWTTAGVRLVAGGKSNLTFELTCEAGSVILRRPPAGHLLPKAHDMHRESRIQRALAGTTVPVAAILLEEVSPGTLDVPFYVMEKVSGHVLRDALPPGYAESAADKVAITDALVDTLAELHRIEPGAVGLATFGRPEGYLQRQLARWTGQWELSRREPVSEVEELARQLASRLPATNAASIVHGDYRLDNCLMALGTPARVAAVLDWELSTLGDPLADLGLLLFYWCEEGEPRPLLTPALTAQPGFPGRDYVVQRYARRHDIDFGMLPVYIAFAAFKFAVIAQGVAARVADGQMAGQEFGDLRQEIVRIAQVGLTQLAGTSMA